jgi:hypothetical protein
MGLGHGESNSMGLCSGFWNAGMSADANLFAISITKRSHGFSRFFLGNTKYFRSIAADNFLQAAHTLAAMSAVFH